MLKDILISVLEKITLDLKEDKYDCSDSLLQSIINELSELSTERPLSKELACNYLHLSRSTFDTLIRDGKLPRGQKQLGLKELTWKRSDLDMYRLTL